MKSLKRDYPIIDGHRKHFVRWPVQITNEMASKNLCALPLVPGKWMAVDVLEKGYSPLISPVQFDTEQDCEKSCYIHNRFHGFDEKEVLEIVGRSMGVVG